MSEGRYWRSFGMDYGDEFDEQGEIITLVVSKVVVCVEVNGIGKKLVFDVGWLFFS